MPPTHRHPPMFSRCFHANSRNLDSRDIVWVTVVLYGDCSFTATDFLISVQTGASGLKMNPQHSSSWIPTQIPPTGRQDDDINGESLTLAQPQHQNVRDGEHSDPTQPHHENNGRGQNGDKSAGIRNENSIEGGHNPGSTEAQTEGSDGPSHLGLTELQVERKEGIEDKIMNPVMQPYRQVKNLLWIKRNTVYSTALEEWDRTTKLLAERVDRMAKRSGGLKNEIYQLVGFFSVFQGVVLTAVTQMTQSADVHTTCKKVWSPSLLTALAWAVTTYGVWQKLHRIQKLDDECSSEDEARREVVDRASDLREQGSAFEFSQIKEKLKKRKPKEFLGIRRSFWIKRFGVVFATLSLFTGVFIASYFLILCSRGLAPI